MGAREGVKKEWCAMCFFIGFSFVLFVCVCYACGVFVCLPFVGVCAVLHVDMCSIIFMCV